MYRCKKCDWLFTDNPLHYCTMDRRYVDTLDDPDIEPYPKADPSEEVAAGPTDNQSQNEGDTATSKPTARREIKPKPAKSDNNDDNQ